MSDTPGLVEERDWVAELHEHVLNRSSEDPELDHATAVLLLDASSAFSRANRRVTDLRTALERFHQLAHPEFAVAGMTFDTCSGATCTEVRALTRMHEPSNEIPPKRLVSRSERTFDGVLVVDEEWQDEAQQRGGEMK